MTQVAVLHVEFSAERAITSAERWSAALAKSAKAAAAAARVIGPWSAMLLKQPSN